MGSRNLLGFGKQSSISDKCTIRANQKESSQYLQLFCHEYICRPQSTDDATIFCPQVHLASAMSETPFFHNKEYLSNASPLERTEERSSSLYHHRKVELCTSKEAFIAIRRRYPAYMQEYQWVEMLMALARGPRGFTRTVIHLKRFCIKHNRLATVLLPFNMSSHLDLFVIEILFERSLGSILSRTNGGSYLPYVHSDTPPISAFFRIEGRLNVSDIAGIQKIRPDIADLSHRRYRRHPAD
jgi:hypothetical protein